MKRIAILAIVALSALPLAAQTRQSAADIAAASTNGGTLVGSWVATVNVDPAIGVPPFKELYTFHNDGTLVMVDDNAPGPPFPFTPGHGVWKRSNGGYVYKVVNLIYDPTTFLSNGNTSILNNVKVDGDNFSGTGHGKFFGPDGVLLFEADATIIGTRITIDEP